MAKSRFRKSVEAIAEIYEMKEQDVAMVLLDLLAHGGWGDWRAL